MGDMGTDLRQAFRSLRRQPRFTALVVATLGLGIGPAAAVFGMVDQLLLRALPGVGNTTAAYLQLGEPGRNNGLSLPDFDELRRRTTLLEGAASYGLTSQSVAPDEGRPISVLANVVYGDYFELLGVQAAEGRILTAAETVPDANALVAVISQNLRNRLFGSDGEVVGRTLRMNGHAVGIVGIAGGGFRGVERGLDIDAWLPLGALVPLVGFTADRLVSRESTMHGDILVRPRAGVVPEAIEGQAGAILTQLAATHPEDAEHLLGMRPTLYEGLHTPPQVREFTNRTLSMMAWAVALIVAVACANVANLLLFRNLARRGAVATHRALGASTGRIARQHLAESFCLGVLGGLAGVAVAWAITLPFQGESLVQMPAFERFSLGWDMVAFVVVASLGAALLFGGVPAALAGRFDLGAALRATRARETGRLGPLRVALTAGQTAMTLALVVGGLLMVRTIANLHRVETGLDIEGVLGVAVLPRAGVDHAVLRSLLEATQAIPGVEHAALDLHGPHGSRSVARVSLPGATDPQVGLESITTVWPVTPGWFDLFGVEPISGSTFADSDWQVPSAGAVVLTASLARRLFGRTDVVGRTLMVTGYEPEERTILGVIGDYVSLADPAQPTDALFVPFGDLDRPQLTMLVRASAATGDLAANVRSVMEAYLPDLPIPEPTPLTDRVDNILGEQRMLRTLLGILSVFGVSMSAVGLYGAIYFMVSSRRREFGIRLALGADARRILRLVARSAGGIVVGGIAVGLLAAYALSSILQSRLFGVGTLDALSYTGAAVLLATATVLACMAPARAALRADPVATLREE